MKLFYSRGKSLKYSVLVILSLVFLSCSVPFKTACAETIRYLCKTNGCTVQPDKKAATKKPSELISFAQASDIHIVDKGNPLRIEEVTVENQNLQNLLDTIFPEASAATKPIGKYTALLWNYVIENINDEHGSKPLDFIVATGDFSDTSTLSEYRLFAELVQGGSITHLKKHCPECSGDESCSCPDETIIPDSPAGLDPVFYATTGNHDLEYMGSFHTDGIVGLLIKNLALGIDIYDLAYIQNIINIFKDYDKSLHFAYDMDLEIPRTGKTKGAYSFSPAPFIHCIVLNTSEYTYVKNGNETPLENLSLGVLSSAQFAWLLNEIDSNSDKLCMIFSHHGPNWFWPLIGKNDQHYMTAGKVKEALKMKPNLVAWFNGHSHMNKIRAEINEEGSGYWDINTSAIVAFPYEWRRISVQDTGNGMGVITTDMVYPSNIDRSKVLHMEDKGDALDLNKGSVLDRDVKLYFRMPPEVAKAIVGEEADPGEDPEPEEGETPPAVEDSGGSSGGICFISAGSL